MHMRIINSGGPIFFQLQRCRSIYAVEEEVYERNGTSNSDAVLEKEQFYSVYQELKGFAVAIATLDRLGLLEGEFKLRIMACRFETRKVAGDGPNVYNGPLHNMKQGLYDFTLVVGILSL